MDAGEVFEEEVAVCVGVEFLDFNGEEGFDFEEPIDAEELDDCFELEFEFDADADAVDEVLLLFDVFFWSFDSSFSFFFEDEDLRESCEIS